MERARGGSRGSNGEQSLIQFPTNQALRHQRAGSTHTFKGRVCSKLECNHFKCGCPATDLCSILLKNALARDFSPSGLTISKLLPNTPVATASQELEIAGTRGIRIPFKSCFTSCCRSAPLLSSLGACSVPSVWQSSLLSDVYAFVGLLTMLGDIHCLKLREGEATPRWIVGMVEQN